MKKNFIFSALLFSGILISCGKSEIKTTNNASAISDAKGGNIDSKQGPPTPLNVVLLTSRWLDDDLEPGVEGKNFGCLDIGGYCRTKNILRAIDVPVINDILNDGVSHYQENFQTHQSQLKMVFEEQLVDGVASGNLTLKIRGNIQNGKNAYFVFNQNGETIAVSPVGL